MEDDFDYGSIATMTEADRDYAYGLGTDRPDCAWILSDRDVWYKNPYYKGPPEPHPEDAMYGD